MTDSHPIKPIPLTAAAIMLVAVLSSGCGPLRSVSPGTSSSANTAGTASASGLKTASVIVPEDSLPPLPGVMSGEGQDPESGTSGPALSGGEKPAGSADAASGATTDSN